jgi:protein-tyrosine sulfotransferase
MHYLKKHIFLIVGCQRSGSTLLESIFAAHPLVRVIGEENWKSYSYFDDRKKLAEFPEKFIGLRIPAATPALNYIIAAYPDAKVLFTLRDPRDVVTSMRKLQMEPFGHGKNTSWLETIAQPQIENCLKYLPDGKRWKAALHSVRQNTNDKNDVRFGGLCWMVKNSFLELYQRSVIKTEIVRYESLIGDPEQYLRPLCDFLDLEWSDRVLEHQKYVSGMWAGTNKGEEIHRRSIGAYKYHLSLEERRSLYSVIQGEMEKHGYSEHFDVPETEHLVSDVRASV